MEGIVDKVLNEFEKAGEMILKDSERWNKRQKIVAFLVCLLAAVALVGGVSHVRVAAAVTVALFGVAFLTFARKAVEAETLVVKDRKGNPRIAISGDYGMYFFDDKMRVRMIAKVDTEQRAIIQVGPLDSRGIMLSASDEEATVTLTRQARKPSLYLKVAEAGSSASVGEEANLTAIANSDGNLGLVLANEDGEPTTILGSKDFSSHLTFYGEKKFRIAEYPDAESVKKYLSALAEGSQVPGMLQTKVS